MKQTFIFLILLGLLFGVANADPETTLAKAREDCLSQLPATYKVEGYTGVAHLPRKRPDYIGKLVLTPDGEHFRILLRTPDGDFKGLALLDNGRLLSKGRALFQLAAGLVDEDGHQIVRLYTVERPQAGGDPWVLDGPGLNGADQSFEHSVQLVR